MSSPAFNIATIQFWVLFALGPSYGLRPEQAPLQPDSRLSGSDRPRGQADYVPEQSAKHGPSPLAPAFRPRDSAVIADCFSPVLGLLWMAVSLWPPTIVR
jgi:hypothetical protein